MTTPIIGEAVRAEATAPGGGDLISETTTQDFMADVVEASKSVTVLVDFWAPWCGPCRQLTPILEKAVKAANGRVKLVKLNIDEHPTIPGQMGVQSIPAVFAFADGQPVDGFMGVLAESQVQAFIDKVAGPDQGDPPGDALADALEQAETLLAGGDAASAAQLFAEILKQDAQNPQAIGGLARCYISTGALDRAEETLKLAPIAIETSEAITSARAMLELAQTSADPGETEALQAAVDADPGNAKARYDLSLALNARGDRDGAAAQLIAIVMRERDWDDGAARAQLLKFFDAWGSKDPATVSGRQRLASALFS